MKRDKFAALLVTTALALGAVAGAYASDSANPQPGHIVDRASFEHYLELFNQKDPAAFEQYYAANVRMSNGGLVFNGIPEVEAHYRNIWGAMEEQVIVEDFLFDGKTLRCNCTRSSWCPAMRPRPLSGRFARGSGSTTTGPSSTNSTKLGNSPKSMSVTTASLAPLTA